MLREVYLSMEIIPGDLDDADVLEAESEKANVDFMEAIRDASKRKTPCYVLHTSGAKIIAWEMESQPQTWVDYPDRDINDRQQKGYKGQRH
ncbi:hypothetical protein N7522_009864 [Penicillium canescens]|nr:hypothetical protein N7522_009864 [Penicillium canescens]